MRRSAALVAAALALGSGCASRPDTTVQVQSVDADIVFGEGTDKRPPAAPAGLGVLEGGFTDTGGELGIDDKGLLRRLPPPAGPLSVCPAADRLAFPNEEAGFNVAAPPQPGIRRYKRNGTIETTTPVAMKLPISGFEKRVVQNVARVDATTFSFEVAQIELGSGDLVTSTYVVRTRATNQPLLNTGLRVGVPDRGLALTRVERRDPKSGDLRSTFRPTPPVLLLPLPIAPGESFEGIGTDPTNGAFLQVSGRVIRRTQIDACGDVVAGWIVESTRSFTSPGQAQAAHVHNYVVAPQLGALIIEEHIEISDLTTGTLKATFTLAQLNPDPIPAKPRR